jgi:succinate-semialdehyde dehydrogenase/glutarate-semialdehyde dehydrogenase
MPAYDDELFGPVASLIKAKDLDEAIEISNHSKYGLGGGIFGSEEEVVEVAKKKLDTGVINVNGFSLAKPHLPYGGVKDSGYGREHGESGFKEFVNTKTIMIHQ